MSDTKLSNDQRIRLPHPCGFITPTKRQRVIFAIASISIIVFTIFEWVMHPPSDMFSIIHAGLYVVLLAAIPLYPYQASCLLLILSICSIFISYPIAGPSDFFGIWYATLVVSILHISLVPAVTYTLLITLIQAASNISNSNISLSGLTTIALFNLMFLSLGIYLRLENKLRRKTLEAELAKRKLNQQKEYNDLMNHLHDSVAGDLTYAIMLLREGRDNPTSSVLQILEHSLTDIRSIVHKSANIERNFSERCKYENLCQLITQCGNRLHSMGYEGRPVLHYQDQYLSNRLYADLKEIIEEITTNILKHGRKGKYVLAINISNESIEIISSNLSRTQFRGDEKRHYGIFHLQELASRYSGTLIQNHDDEEWTLCITLPIA